MVMSACDCCAAVIDYLLVLVMICLVKTVIVYVELLRCVKHYLSSVIFDFASV